MPELRIHWQDGRTEVRSVHLSQTTHIGDFGSPIEQRLHLGSLQRIGRQWRYGHYVVVHGREMPLILWVTGSDCMLPTARSGIAARSVLAVPRRGRYTSSK